MKPCTFWLLAVLLCPQAVVAQNLDLIDSLQSELASATGIDRFNLLNDLAWEHRFAHPDSTIVLSRQAYALGQRLNLSSDLARPLNFTGIAYNYKGDRLRAYDYYIDAMKVATEQSDSFQIAHTNNNLGRLFYEQGMLSKAYPYYENARRIFRMINDSSGLAYTYQSLGNLYKSQRDYTKAEANLHHAYQIRLVLGNQRDIMSALVYLGRHYLEAHQVEHAVKYFLLADSTGQVINDAINLAEIKTYLAESYLALGRIGQAERICQAGLDVIAEGNNVRMMPQAYHTMGQVLFHRGDMIGAREYFERALRVATRIRDLNGKMDASYSLWKVAEQLNLPAEGLKHHNAFLILKDSVKDLDLAREVERRRFEMEIQRKEQENELLKETEAKNEALIERQRLQNMLLIVTIVLLAILGATQWMHAKRRRLANEQLLMQNEEIQQQREEILSQNEKLSRRNLQLSDLNHEKDTLMSIVAHDLKAPLNRIQGLINLMSMNGSHEEVDRAAYLHMLKDATRSGLDLITDLLDVHMLEENVQPNYTVFDISQFLLKKTEMFQTNASAKGIHLNITRVESEEIRTDRAYLDRIFENLLSNAIKFSPKHSVIDIAADRTDQEFWISVRDKGPGFSPTDKSKLYQKFRKLSARPTGGESSNGLGLAIVKILVERLHGRIELVSEEGKGSQFVVRFPQEAQVL